MLNRLILLAAFRCLAADQHETSSLAAPHDTDVQDHACQSQSSCADTAEVVKESSSLIQGGMHATTSFDFTDGPDSTSEQAPRSQVLDQISKRVAQSWNAAVASVSDAAMSFEQALKHGMTKQSLLQTEDKLHIWLHKQLIVDKTDTSFTVCLISLALFIVGIIFCVAASGVPVVNQRRQQQHQMDPRQGAYSNPQYSNQSRMPIPQTASNLSQHAGKEYHSGSMMPPRVSAAMQPPYANSRAGTGSNLRPPPTSTQPPPSRGQFPALCPELLVPKECECTLLGPRLPPTTCGKTFSGQVSLDDSKGSAVFQVFFDLGSVRTDTRRLTLMSATGEALFAFCCDDTSEKSSNAPPTLRILSSGEKFWGIIRMEGRDRDASYTVHSQGGFKIRFVGDVLAGKMTAQDDDNKLLATSDPLEPAEAGRRCIRIGPHVDAGLLALSFLGIDVLEHQMRSRR